MAHDDCLFCKIIAGAIPCKKVYEDDAVLAFDDISPMMPVHTLVVPKEHFDNLADDVPEEVLGVDQTGYRIVSNAGADARQSVMHLHVHVLGGQLMNMGDPRE